MDTTKSKRMMVAGIGFLTVVVALGGTILFSAGKKPAARAPRPAPDVQRIRAAAEGGDATAQNVLGDLYAKGEGVPQNYGEAFKWYRSAAEKDVADAQYNLAVLYETGLGVTRDEAEAMKWHRKAAEQGHAGAEYNLAAMYATGRGVSQDATKAAEWYRKAAEQGDSLAQYNLARRYEVGKGVPVDRVEPYKWHKLAARQGIEDAAQALDSLKGQMTREEISEGERRSSKFIAGKPAPSVSN
jgi:TPR repeat protein